MNIIYVNKNQLSELKQLTNAWDGNARWLPAMAQYLWENDIRPTEDCYPSRPDTYNFIAGGIDHIDQTSRSITVHDRCLQVSSGTIDGTTKFVGR